MISVSYHIVAFAARMETCAHVHMCTEEVEGAAQMRGNNMQGRGWALARMG